MDTLLKSHFEHDEYAQVMEVLDNSTVCHENIETAVALTLVVRLRCTGVVDSPTSLTDSSCDVDYVASVDLDNYIQPYSVYDISIRNAPLGYAMACDTFPWNDVYFRDTKLSLVSPGDLGIFEPNQSRNRIGYLVNLSSRVTHVNHIFMDFSPPSKHDASINLDHATLYLCRRQFVDWGKLRGQFRDDEITIQHVINEDSVMQFIPPLHRSSGWAGTRLRFETIQGEAYGDNDWHDSEDQDWEDLDAALITLQAQQRRRGRGVRRPSHHRKMRAGYVTGNVDLDGENVHGYGSTVDEEDGGESYEGSDQD